MVVKKTFTYYIDAIVYTILLTFIIKILEHFKIDFSYIYVIIFTLIIFVSGKMLLRKLMYNRKEEIN